MKLLTASRLKKIEAIKQKLERVQYDLYSFDNENADYAAFELNDCINKLENAKTWYEKKLGSRR
jgi:hypothetical protein